ncbi:TOMM precursor leader peptide-binding protein [Cognatiyoonia sp. IB215182]|uniref:TOMM precursor leader peptide-binding protein n=1 Tax=Cognatiyoonia sp. IB215182 TaxID=3097353 RepID=UPI002A124D70|nr:TOMM precursor leader peptide-binding protein [Cognatiyoonia sp. IB215182]MDX8353929.1 TOMM precursor leader peptide-binding protein [Cognatiyoonia sp. IB215182]
MTDQEQIKAEFALRKPLLPKCFLHWTEAANGHEDETLRFVSWRRNLTLQGQSFREFEEVVVPLLNGQLDIDAICDKAGHLFSKSDLLASLNTLVQQGILVEGDGVPTEPGAIDRTPQLGWLSETAHEGMAAQKRLEAAHVVVFGAGMHGAVAARALVAAGIGQLTLVDPNEVAASDLYFSGLFQKSDLGRNRAMALATALQAADGATQVTHYDVRPADPNAVMPLISGAHLALCCVESGEQATALYLNMACKAANLAWIAASLEGTNIVLGPGFFRHDAGPCYMCWRMREMSAAQNQFAHGSTEAYLGNLQKDLSGKRENLAVSADIAGGMLAAEALTWLSGTSLPNLDGCFLQITIPGLHMEKHTVLRKPGCSACAAAQAAE